MSEFAPKPIKYTFEPKLYDPEFLSIARTPVSTDRGQKKTDKIVATIDALLDENREILRPSETAGTDAWIRYFDTNWSQENLPKDWYNLKKEVGFSMKSQMALLAQPDHTKSVAEWAQKTKQDLLGFKLEYLSDHLIYPAKYERNANDKTRLENRMYGNKDIVETVSDKERNGSVKKAIQEVKAFLLDDTTLDGSLAVLTSPEGDSGLKTDDGKAIKYPDSYFFIMQKQGETVTNFTLKTDFTPHECREAIYQLTGKSLSTTASLDEYAGAIAKISPKNGNAVNVTDVVGVFETIRTEKGSGLAFQDASWKSVYNDIKNHKKLYEFDGETKKVLDDFEAYCQQGTHTKEEMQKAIAVTILRMSNFFYEKPEQNSQSGTLKPQTWVDMGRHRGARSYGQVLDDVAARSGCAGGGEKTVVDSPGGPRLGKVDSGFRDDGKGSRTFECPDCGRTNFRPFGEYRLTCEHCTSDKVAC